MNYIQSPFEQLRWKSKADEYKFLNDRLTTNETIVVKTDYGKVRGVKRLTVYNDSYYSFEGIPYAQPPVGELRFKAPQKPTAWHNVLDCLSYRNKAIQHDFVTNTVCGSEDCLYLHVYTNNLTPGVKRPVLVFIHGGGFVLGENSRDWYGPDYFITKDIVLITIQYRLGVFGFLSLNSEKLNVPGNAGLKDQIMALRWVKNNCAYFGGNPDSITLFGESAGGASTSHLLKAPQARGLFHKGILMSGFSVCPWAFTQCQHRAFTLAKLAGYKGDDNDQDVLAFLMKCKPYELQKLDPLVLTPEEHANKVIFPFGPTIEPYQTDDAVVIKNPLQMMKTAWGNSIPLMVGNTSYEGLLFTPACQHFPHLIEELETCAKFVPSELVSTDRSDPEVLKLGAIIKKAHVAGEKPTADDFMDLASYKYFWFPMYQVVHCRLRYSSAPTFIYRFDFDSEELGHPFRFMRYGRGVKGVSHADDLTYLFWNILSKRVSKNSREYKTIERMVGMWVNFAVTDNPCNNEIDGMENITWNSVKQSDEVYKCLNISDELKVIDLPEMDKLKQWESLYQQHKELFF